MAGTDTLTYRDLIEALSELRAGVKEDVNERLTPLETRTVKIEDHLRDLNSKTAKAAELGAEHKVKILNLEREVFRPRAVTAAAQEPAPTPAQPSTVAGWDRRQLIAILTGIVTAIVLAAETVKALVVTFVLPAAAK